MKQLVLQLVVPQTYGTQLTGLGVTHAPAPLQVEVLVHETPVQVSAAQVVSVPGIGPHDVRLLPSHCAAHGPVPVHAGRLPFGGPLTALQTPSAPLTLHASHWPPHAPSQQTPSTQKPLPQSLASEQPPPIPRLHTPFGVALQVWPLGHEPVVQQTPSTQKPEAHCEPSPHAVPAAPVGTQTPPPQ